VDPKVLPERFTVQRIGTPDPPGSNYYVLNVTSDHHARVALRALARGYRLYGSKAAADELEQYLNDTQPDHQAFVVARDQAMKKAAR